MTDGDGVCSQIATWIAKLKFEDIPRRVVGEAKNQILSVIASVHAGHFSDAGRVISRAVKEWGAGKEATFIPSGERVSLQSALYGNAALCMALAYDDHLVGAHTGASSVVASLALAEKLGSDGQDFVLAQVLANEIEGRLGLSMMRDALSQYRTPYAHLIGGAAIAAKLRKLDVEQTRHAIGMAMQFPVTAPAEGFTGSDAKIVSAALLTPAGVYAADLAANGFRAPIEVFDEAGALERLGASAPMPELFRSLGNVWLTETLGYSVYPCCVYVNTALDCVLALLRQHNIDARKIRGITVNAGPAALEMNRQVTPFLNGAETMPSALNFSVAYNVAAALIDKELSPRQLTRDRIKDPAIWELAGKVSLGVDDDATRDAEARSLPRQLAQAGGDLSRVDLSSGRSGYGASVRVEMQNDRVYELHREAPIGFGNRPFDDRLKVVEDKFRRETRYSLRKERMERAIDTVHHIEDANAAAIKDFVRNSCSER
jgi:2-methylcitrate dehydratase PrpD